MQNLEKSRENIKEHYIEMLKLVLYLLNLNQLCVNDKNLKEIFIETKKTENIINSLEVIIKETSIIAIVRYQPTAKNLRFFIMMFNSARLLERMADLLKASIDLISKIKNIEKDNINYFQEIFKSNIYLIENTFNQYIDAFFKNDLELIYHILKEDNKIDEKIKENENKIIELTNKNEVLLLYWNLNKKYSRFFDHIIHLLNDLVYIINGENLRKKELEIDNIF